MTLADIDALSLLQRSPLPLKRGLRLLRRRPQRRVACPRRRIRIPCGGERHLAPVAGAGGARRTRGARAAGREPLLTRLPGPARVERRVSGLRSRPERPPRCLYHLGDRGRPRMARVRRAAAGAVLAPVYSALWRAGLFLGVFLALGGGGELPPRPPHGAPDGRAQRRSDGDRRGGVRRAGRGEERGRARGPGRGVQPDGRAPPGALCEPRAAGGRAHQGAHRDAAAERPPGAGSRGEESGARAASRHKSAFLATCPTSCGRRSTRSSASPRSLGCGWRASSPSGRPSTWTTSTPRAGTCSR